MNEEELKNQLLSEFHDYSSGNEDDEIDQDDESSLNKIGALLLISFIWIQGIRSNSNLMYVPHERQIYCANGENKSYEAIRFRCYANNCQAKTYLRKDGTAVRESSSKHNHVGTMYEKYKQMKCINAMKKMCLSAPVSTTTREIYNQAVLE